WHVYKDYVYCIYLSRSICLVSSWHSIHKICDGYTLFNSLSDFYYYMFCGLFAIYWMSESFYYFLFPLIVSSSLFCINFICFIVFIYLVPYALYLVGIPSIKYVMAILCSIGCLIAIIICFVVYLQFIG